LWTIRRPAMAYILPVGAFASGSGSNSGSSSGTNNRALNRFTEAQVEGALSILEQEAGLSEETMSTLRLAVESGLSRRRAHDDMSAQHVSAQQQAAALGGGFPMFSFLTSQQMTQQLAGMVGMSFGMVQAAEVPAQAAQAAQTHACGPHALAQAAFPAAPHPGSVLTHGGVGGTPAAPGLDSKAYGMKPRSVKPSSSKRQQLTVEEAAEIYLLRPRRGERSGGMMHCRTLAPKYGVTPKTIRDVWSGRTWAEATRHLWTPEEIAQRKRMQSERSNAKTESQSCSDDLETDLEGSASQSKMSKRPKQAADKSAACAYQKVGAKTEDAGGAGGGAEEGVGGIR
jgi:hypothetical protein